MRRALALIAAAVLAACAPVKAPDHMAESKAFLAKNATAEGVKTLPSGLQFKIVREGPKGGLRPQETDEVKVNYEGKLASGRVFDSSYERGQPAALPLRGLIPGWIEALKLMRPGDEWVLYVPPELGYGDRRSGEIPPNSVLIFRIELLGVLPGPGRVQNG
jgi:peptidylprolyl isomerase/FKBP-type peptidyl-prolyl cis-trans isomerase FklB